MGKKKGAYKSAKRNKELMRQKKREEKRLRRLAKGESPQKEGGDAESDTETPLSEISES